MSKFKEFLDQLFPEQEGSAAPHKIKPRVKGKAIRCCDCGQFGYFALPSPREYRIPDGWNIVWVGLLKHVFICGSCQEKRRQWARQLMAKPTSAKPAPKKTSRWDNLQAFDLDL